MLIGYPHGQKGYKLYNLEGKKTYVSKDVVFKEGIFPFLLKPGKENEMKAIVNDIPFTGKEQETGERIELGGLEEIEEEVDEEEEEEKDNGKEQVEEENDGEI